jgi:hypothetical protein
MADPFNEMRKLDQAALDRDLELMIRQYQANGTVPDFDKLHRMFKKWALQAGMSSKGAQAKATIQLQKFKELMHKSE